MSVGRWTETKQMNASILFYSRLKVRKREREGGGRDTNNYSEVALQVICAIINHNNKRRTKEYTTCKDLSMSETSSFETP